MITLSFRFYIYDNFARFYNLKKIENKTNKSLELPGFFYKYNFAKFYNKNKN